MAKLASASGHSDPASRGNAAAAVVDDDFYDGDCDARSDGSEIHDDEQGNVLRDDTDCDDSCDDGASLVLEDLGGGSSDLYMWTRKIFVGLPSPMSRACRCTALIILVLAALIPQFIIFTTLPAPPMVPPTPPPPRVALRRPPPRRDAPQPRSPIPPPDDDDDEILCDCGWTRVLGQDCIETEGRQGFPCWDHCCTSFIGPRRKPRVRT